MTGRYPPAVDVDTCRTAMIDRAARAVFNALYVQAGRTRLPQDYEKLGPAMKERCEIIAIRVLQSVGMIQEVGRETSQAEAGHRRDRIALNLETGATTEEPSR